VNFNSSELENLFEEEMEKLRAKMIVVEEERREKESRRRLLQEQSETLRLECERSISELYEIEKQLVEADLMMENKVVSLKPVSLLEAPPETNFESFALPQSQSKEMQERIIQIRAEFCEKMRAALDKVRKQYKREYKQFIGKIDAESEELMNNIEAVVAKRAEHEAARDYKDALLQLMDRRSYPERIQKLENDIELTLKRIQDKQDVLDTLGQNFNDDMNLIDEELDKIKEELKKLLNEFSAYAKTKYGDHHEILLYSQLLDFETSRLGETKTEKKITVRGSQGNYTRETREYHSEVSMITRTSKREISNRRESGYKSDGDDKSKDDFNDSEYPRDKFLSELEPHI